jgi:hypothetical protein
MPNTSKAALAKVIGRAVLHKEFAEALKADPAAAANSIGVHLTPAQVKAVGNISLADVSTVSDKLRGPLGNAAFFDQQQQQQQARMD